MPAVYRTSAAGGGTTGTTDRTASITPAVGDLLIVACNVTTNTNAAPTCSDNNPDGMGQYALIGTAVWGSSANTMSVFVRLSFCYDTTATTVTVATGSNDAGEIIVTALSGAPYCGLAAVRQFAIQSNQTTGTTAAPAFGSACLTTNVTFAIQGGNDTTSTTPTNWTERQDANQATPTTALQVCTRNSGFTGTTVTWGASTTGNYCALILEINSSGPASVRASAAGGDTTDNQTTHTATITTVKDDLLVVACQASGNNNTTPTCSDNQGGSYDRILVAASNGSADTMSVFVRQTLVTAAQAGSTTVTVTTGSPVTAAEVVVLAVAGMKRAGSGAVWRAAKQENQAAAGTPTPNFATGATGGNTGVDNGYTSPRNLIIAGVGSGDTTTTPPTSFTEHQDVSQATPTTAIEVCSRADGHLSNVVTFGATQANAFASFALELDTSQAWLGSYPRSAAAMAQILGFGTWSHCWLMDEAGGASTLAPAFGANSLTKTGSLVTTGNTGPVQASSDPNDKAIATTNSGDNRFDKTGGTFDIAAGNGFIAVSVVQIISDAGADGNLVANTDGTNLIRLSTLTTTNRFRVGNTGGTAGTANVASATTSVYPTLAKWHVVVWGFDDTAGKVVVCMINDQGMPIMATATADMAAVSAGSLVVGTVGNITFNGAVAYHAALYVGVGANVADGLAANAQTIAQRMYDQLAKTQIDDVDPPRQPLPIPAIQVLRSRLDNSDDASFFVFPGDDDFVPRAPMWLPPPPVARCAALSSEDLSIPMNIDPTAIAGAEAFGTAVQVHDLDPSGVATTEAHGSSHVAHTVAPTAVGASEGHGTTNVVLVAAPTAVVSAEAFGTAHLVHTIAPSGVASSGAFGSTTMVLVIAPTGIGSGEAHGSTTVTANWFIDPSGVASSNAFGTANVGLTIAPSGVASSEAFGTAAVLANWFIDPSGIASGQAFGTSTLVLTVAPSGVVTGEAHGAANITHVVAPSGVASAGAFGTAVLEVFVQPTGVPTGAVFGTAVIVTFVHPAGVSSSEQLGTPTVLASWFIDPSAIASGYASGTANVVEVLAPSSIAGGEAFGTATTKHTLDPSGVGSGEQLGAASLADTTNIDPTGVASAGSVPSPALELAIAAAGVSSSEAFGTANVVLAIAITGVASAGAVPTPVIAYVVAPSAIAGGENVPGPLLELALLAIGVLSGESVPAPVIAHETVFIDTAGVPSSVAVGSTNVGHAIAALGIASGESVALPEVLAGAVIQAIGVPSGEAFGATFIGDAKELNRIFGRVVAAGPVATVHVAVDGNGGVTVAVDRETKVTVTAGPKLKTTIRKD